MRRMVLLVACVCGFWTAAKRAVGSATIRERYRELVWRALRIRQPDQP